MTEQTPATPPSVWWFDGAIYARLADSPVDKLAVMPLAPIREDHPALPADAVRLVPLVTIPEGFLSEEDADHFAAKMAEQAGAVPDTRRRTTSEAELDALVEVLARRAETIASLRELAKDAIEEHRKGWERGQRTGEELHQLDGAKELAESILRILDAGRLANSEPRAVPDTGHPTAEAAFLTGSEAEALDGDGTGAVRVRLTELQRRGGKSLTLTMSPTVACELADAVVAALDAAGGLIPGELQRLRELERASASPSGDTANTPEESR